MEHEQKLRYEYHTRGRQILQWKQTRQATYVEYRSLIMDCFNVIKFLNKCAKVMSDSTFENLKASLSSFKIK